jgi:type III pantothenate kinase
MTTARLLTIKVGNTNLGIGVFENARLLRSWRAETRAEQTADEYAVFLFRFFESADIAPASIGAAAIVSVVPALDETLREFCVKYLGIHPFLARSGIKSGIRIQYDDPRALGADRLVSLVGAKAKYGSPLILIDLGTATTINALDRNGDFVGGAIAPGLNMSAQALHTFTAKLPRIDIGAPPAALATNTRDALRSGIFFGYVGMIEGLVARIRREMNEPTARVIATGGMAELLSRECPVIEAVDGDLALEGLEILYRMNCAS